MISFRCIGCGGLLRLTDDKAGKHGKCPRCHAPFEVPTPSTQAAANGGMAPSADGLAPSSNGLSPSNNGLAPSSNGLAQSNGGIAASGNANPPPAICQTCGGPLRQVMQRDTASGQTLCVQCHPPNGTCPFCGAQLRTPKANQCSSCKASWHRNVNGPSAAPESVAKAQIAVPAQPAPFVPAQRAPLPPVAVEDFTDPANSEICWFCKKTEAGEQAGVQISLAIRKWKFTRVPSGFEALIQQVGEDRVIQTLFEKFDLQLIEQMYGEDVLRRVPVRKARFCVPRCSVCSKVHATVKGKEAAFFRSGRFMWSLLLSFVLPIASVILLGTLHTFIGTLCALLAAVAIAVLVILSIANGKRLKRLLGNILPEDDASKHDRIQQLVRDGWEL